MRRSPGRTARKSVVFDDVDRDQQRAPATRDTLFEGRVQYAQPARGYGYRVNVDALLLARFAAEGGRTVHAAWDLGSGAGAVALGLLHLNAAETVTMVERDADAAKLARANLESNGWSTRGDIRELDVAKVTERGVADLVVCNPPYILPKAGRPAKVPSRQSARSGAVGPFVAAARQIASSRARLCFVYPANDLANLLSELREVGLEAKRLRLVHAKEDVPARIALVEAKAGKRGGLVIAPAWSG